MRHSTRAGFTLIDVVVGAAFVAMAVVVLLPAVGRVRQAALADREKAAARLTQKAWHLYSQDNRDKLLPASGHWDWVHPSSPSGPNVPRLQPSDPFRPGSVIDGTAAKFWTAFLMAQVPMQTDQIQVDAATRTIFDARNPSPSSISQSFTQYANSSKPAAYIMHPSVGMNGVYVGGSYPHGAFRGNPTTGANPMQSGGRFYVTTEAEIRRPDSLIVFASARGSDVINDSAFFSYGASDPNFGTARPGYWLVTPPKPHPRGRGSSLTPYTLGGGWNASNTFNSAMVPGTWGMIDIRSSGAAATALADGHVEAQTLEQLRDMRKWSNYATSADWNFQAGPLAASACAGDVPLALMGTPHPQVTGFIDELQWRGMLHQCTDETALRKHLGDPAAAPRRAYVGFDPTADSLTIGNLVPIMMLVHFARAGHTPVVLMGGGTGLIGDPSGKSAERELQSEDRVRANVDSQREIFRRVFSGAGCAEPPIVNNADWLGKLGYIEVLRDVGKHFSVNQMIQRDSVKNRLESREQGISYTEFSYMILQAYDFLHLYRSDGVTLQMGGSDQFGNIVSGCDLIRRAGARGEIEGVSHGATAPLITKADGGKFGKTEAGAVWLSPHRTSAYAYYQFWLNAADADVGKFLRTFTLLPKDQIEALEAEQASNPGARPAQRALARAATDLLHGVAARESAEAAAAALFSGEVASLPLDVLNEALAAAPSSRHARNTLAGGLSLLEVLSTTLCKSKSEARQALVEGSVSINGRKASLNDSLTSADLLHGQVIALRRGKKNWHVTRWE